MTVAASMRSLSRAESRADSAAAAAAAAATAAAADGWSGGHDLSQPVPPLLDTMALDSRMAANAGIDTFFCAGMVWSCSVASDLHNCHCLS